MNRDLNNTSIPKPYRFRFPKSNRLVGRGAFAKVIRQGGFAAGDRLVIQALPNERAETRFGITIPKKTGNAVIRNRWKRLIREGIRHCRHNLPMGYDIVIRPKRDAVPDPAAIRGQLQQTARRAIRRYPPK